MLFINSNTSCSHIEASEVKDYIGKIIKIHGIVHKIREMSGFAFVILRTKQSMFQCIYSEEFSNFKLGEIKENMGVIVSGEVIADKRSRTGAELRIKDFEIVSTAVDELPIVINNKEMACSLETLLDYRPITLRNEKERSIFKLQAGICQSIRRFLDENNFTEIHSPKIVYNGAEGGANIFSLNYFGRKAFLTQSPQFYKQMMVGTFERVYEIGPVFRAEKHDTSRHINEYTSIDLEMGFIENFYDICRMETKMLAYTFEFLKEHYSKEISLLEADIPQITEIPSIEFLEAKELVSKTYNRKITDFEDFEPEEEKLLCEIIKKQYNCDFIFVTHYKSSKRPFYAMDTKENPEVTESFDLIFRGMEITTGGQRINDYNMQLEKMLKRSMNPENFADFLMAHKYGLPPHGGLGLGLERLTGKILGFQNIRLSTMFPRDINRLTP